MNWILNWFGDTSFGIANYFWVWVASVVVSFLIANSGIKKP